MTSSNETNRVQSVDVQPYQDVYFNVDKFPEALNRYVFFVDIMGMKTTMLRSFSKSTIFMGKLHCVLKELQKKLTSVKVYPVMDGAYVVSKDIFSIRNFINMLFTWMGQIFVLTENVDNCFMVRGCLAFGPMIGGEEIGAEVNKELSEDVIYKGNLLFGFPMILAVNGEKKAPPFGVYLDITVRVNENKKLSGIWYKWCKDEALQKGITKGLENYFNWVRNNNIELMYDEDRINCHEKMAKQYWHLD